MSDPFVSVGVVEALRPLFEPERDNYGQWRLQPGYTVEHLAASVVQAIRSMSVQQQAELIGRPVFVAADDPKHDEFKWATSTVTDPQPGAFIMDASPAGFAAPLDEDFDQIENYDEETP